MGAGWLYYHKYPPKRKCPHCHKRMSLRRVGVFSNGEDVWRFPEHGCPQSNRAVTPYYDSGSLGIT